MAREPDRRGWTGAPSSIGRGLERRRGRIGPHFRRPAERLGRFGRKVGLGPGPPRLCQVLVQVPQIIDQHDAGGAIEGGMVRHQNQPVTPRSADGGKADEGTLGETHRVRQLPDCCPVDVRNLLHQVDRRPFPAGPPPAFPFDVGNTRKDGVNLCQGVPGPP